jgi:hypothetical protein
MLDVSEFGYPDDVAFCEMLARDVGVGACRAPAFSVRTCITDPPAFCERGQNTL